MFLPFLVITNIIYLMAFEHMPGSIRMVVAAALCAGYLGGAVVGVANRATPGIVIMMFCACFILFAWISGGLLDPGDPMRSRVTVQDYFRSSMTYFGPIAILSYAERIPRTAVLIAIGLMIAFASLVALLSPDVVLNGIPRFAPFTGETTTDVLDEPWRSPGGIHPSAYAIVLCLLIVVSLWQTGYIRFWLALLFAMPTLVLLSGYRVRTTIVMLVAFVIGQAGVWLARRIQGGRLLVSSGLCLGVGAVLVAFIVSDFYSSINLYELTQGRSNNYLDRLELFHNRDAIPFLFGTGPGSDAIATTDWWWDAFDSHNDFLRAMVESGIFGPICLLLFLIGVLRQVGVPAVPYLLAIMSASAVSNGLFARPTTMPLMFIAIGIVAASRRKQQHVPDWGLSMGRIEEVPVLVGGGRP